MNFSALAISLAAWIAIPMWTPAEVDATPIRQITEGTSLTIDRDTFEPIQLVPESLRLARGPDHGFIGSSSTRGTFIYRPHDFYIGFDRLIFMADQLFPRQTILLELKVRVLPTTLPVAGTFAEHSYGAFGLYHQAATAFELCDPWQLNGNELKCSLWPVAGASPGWLPVYGDWDGDGFHLPSLFDPATGVLHHLERDPDAGELSITLSVLIPETEWTWPVAGDWDGNGTQSLLLMSDTGEIFEAFDLNAEPWTQRWSNTLVTPPGDAFPFPTLWPFSQDAARDSVAVIDFTNRALSWISLFKDGTTSGTIELNRIEGRQIPFAASSAVLDSTPDLFYLELEVLGNSVSLWINHWSFGHPSTLPLKFPHEPPGI